MNFIGEINDTTEITALRIRTPVFKDDDDDDTILNKNNINIKSIFILIFFCFLLLYFLY